VTDYRRRVLARITEATTFDELNAAAHHPDWLTYRVLSADGVAVVQDWRSKRQIIITHWRAVWACVRQGDPSLLGRFAGVTVGGKRLETDPGRIVLADESGVLGLPRSKGEPKPWYPEAGT
jgi:hypothetical protein